MGYWNNTNDCPFLHFEKDENYILAMCELHPEKIYGVNDNDCLNCKHYSEKTTFNPDEFFSAERKEKDMAYKLSKENILIVQQKVLSEVDYWEDDATEALKKLAYLEGVRAMADAVIDAIKELGGN